MQAVVRSGHLARKLFYRPDTILTNVRTMSPQLAASLKSKVNNPTLFQKTVCEMKGSPDFLALTEKAESSLWTPYEAEVKFTARTTVHHLVQELVSMKNSDPITYDWVPDQSPVVLYKSKRLESNVCLQDLNLTDEDHLVMCDDKLFLVPVVYEVGEPTYVAVPSCTDTVYVLKGVIKAYFGVEMEDQLLSLCIPNFKPSMDISSSDNKRLVDLGIYDQKYYPHDSKMTITLNVKDKTMEQPKSSQKVHDLADVENCEDMPIANSEVENSSSSQDGVNTESDLPTEQQTGTKYAVSAVKKAITDGVGDLSVTLDRQKLVGRCIQESFYLVCVIVVTNLLGATFKHHPPERERSIHELVLKNDDDHDEFVKEFDMSYMLEVALVEARVLAPMRLKYHEPCRAKSFTLGVGQCSMIDKGSSIFTPYRVLYDENKFTADACQMLTNNLCCRYAESDCTRFVFVPSAYYAHLASFCGRCYNLEGESDYSSAGGGGDGAGGNQERAAVVRLLLLYC